MGRCLDPIKEIERRRKISLSLLENKHAFGHIPTEEELKKRSKGLIKAHKKKEFGFKKGFTPWNKDKTGIFSKETLRIMSEKLKGTHPVREFKKGNIPWNKGLTISDKRVQRWHKKTSQAQRKLYAVGKLIVWNKDKKTGFISKNPEETRRKHSEAIKGEKHWNWIDGRSKDKTYRFKEQKKWVEKNKVRKYFLEERRRAIKKKAKGSFSFEEWLELKKKFNYTCPMCGQREPFVNQRCQFLTIDHIIPLNWGGTNYINNIQPLCLKCNSKKHTQIIFFEPLDLLSSKLFLHQLNLRP